MQITEKQLNAYLNKAINEELLEGGLLRSVGKRIVKGVLGRGDAETAKEIAKRDREIMAFIQKHGDDGYRAALRNSGENWTQEDIAHALNHYKQNGPERLYRTMFGKQRSKQAAERNLSYLKSKDVKFIADPNGNIRLNPRYQSQQNLSGQLDAFDEEYFKNLINKDKKRTVRTDAAAGALATGALESSVSKAISNQQAGNNNQEIVNATKANDEIKKAKLNQQTGNNNQEIVNAYQPTNLEEWKRRDIRLASNAEKVDKAKNAKERLLKNWGYNWQDNLNKETNQACLDKQIAAIQAKGAKNYPDYLSKTYGYTWDNTIDAQTNIERCQAQKKEQQNTSVDTTSPEGEKAAQQKKYNVNERAPFANVKSRVMQFQTWFNDNNQNNRYGVQQPLVVDGIWGENTQRAWAAWLTAEGRAI